MISIDKVNDVVKNVSQIRRVPFFLIVIFIKTSNKSVDRFYVELNSKIGPLLRTVTLVNSPKWINGIDGRTRDKMTTKQLRGHVNRGSGTEDLTSMCNGFRR